MIFFSIIIPTFNSSHTISRTIDSILSQEFSNYEIIIQDGESKDNTIVIISSLYKSSQEKIRIFSEKDSGIYNAMNKGIHKAKGELILFLGSDDYIIDSKVFLNVWNFYSSNPCEFLYGNVEWGNSNNIYDGEFSRTKIIQKNICHQAIFYRRDTLLKLGGFNEKYKICSDWDLNLKYFTMENQFSINFINLIISHFTMSGVSSNNYDLEFFEDMEKIRIKNFPEEYIQVLKIWNQEHLEHLKNLKMHYEKRDLDYKELALKYNQLLGSFPYRSRHLFSRIIKYLKNIFK